MESQGRPGERFEARPHNQAILVSPDFHHLNAGVPVHLSLLPLTAITFTLSAMPSDTAEVLVARIRTAVGFEHLAKHPKGFLATGQMTVHGKKASCTFAYADSRHMILRSEGELASASARHGDTYWMKAMGGETHMAGPRDTDDLRFELAMLTHAYLDPKSGFHIERIPGSDTPKSLALRLTHPEGKIRGTLLVERQSALPLELLKEVALRKEWLRISAWLNLGGLKVPGELSMGYGEMVSMQVKFASVHAAANAPNGAMPDPLPQGDVVFDPTQPAALEVVRSKVGLTLVHPKVNGKDIGWFILDSGAGMSILTPGALKELGLTSFGSVMATGSVGRTESAYAMPDSVQIGPVTLKRPMVAILDLAAIEKYAERKVGGILGYGLFARAVVEADFAKGIVALYDPAVPRAPGAPWAKLIVDAGQPHVEGEVEGHPGLLLLDTGAANISLSLNHPTVERWKLLEGRKTSFTMMGGVGGWNSARTGTLSQVSFAGHKLEDVKATFHTSAIGSKANPYALGSIGNQILGTFRLVFDYPHQRIALVPKRESKP